jgi:hypothetical protein
MSRDLSELFMLDEEQLFEVAGRGLQPRELSPADVQAYVLLGRAWFRQQSEKLRKTVCGNESVVLIIDEDEKYAHLVEAATIVDSVAGFMHHEQALVFAVLVTKFGLQKYCNG